jgi:hypothetical protein
VAAATTPAVSTRTVSTAAVRRADDLQRRSTMSVSAGGRRSLTQGHWSAWSMAPQRSPFAAGLGLGPSEDAIG